MLARPEQPPKVPAARDAADRSSRGRSRVERVGEHFARRRSSRLRSSRAIKSGPVVGQGTGTPAMTGPGVLPTDTAGTTASGVRMSLKPADSTPGYVDGAWWPRSPDLVVEIPALLARLATGWGAVDRV